MTADEVKGWHAETLGAAAVEALKKNGFEAVYVPDRAAAAEFVMGSVSPHLRVGIGGSHTITALGIKERAAAAGAELLDHNEAGLSPERKLEIRRFQQSCDLFLCSTNALTLEGELLNVDAFGNRTNALTFGPKKVIVVAGVNKICADEFAAWQRIKEYAAPMNNKRLGTQNPCVVKGVCTDCQGPGRICRVYSHLRRKPLATDFTVVVVGEELGF